MLSCVLKRYLALVCMAFAVACVGAEPEEMGEDEAEDTAEAESNVTQAEDVFDDASLLPIPPGCGGFKQVCCEGHVCSSSLECDLATNRCLY